MTDIAEGDVLVYEAEDGLEYPLIVSGVDEHNRTIHFQNGGEIDIAALGSGRFTHVS